MEEGSHFCESKKMKPSRRFYREEDDGRDPQKHGCFRRRAGVRQSLRPKDSLHEDTHLQWRAAENEEQPEAETPVAR